MALFEEEKFLLDDPISNYVPAFKNPTVLVIYDTNDATYGRFKTRPAKGKITIRPVPGPGLS